MEEASHLLTHMKTPNQSVEEKLLEAGHFLKETKCTEVNKCVAKDFDRINNKFMVDDIKFLQNSAEISRVQNDIINIFEMVSVFTK